MILKKKFLMLPYETPSTDDVSEMKIIPGQNIDKS